MGLLQSVQVRNFKCFRAEVSIRLAQATYFIGANNSGKTAILTALRCFFDSTAYLPHFLNKTEVARRQEGSNRSDVTVQFDLTLVTGRVRRQRLIDRYGDSLEVSKQFTVREISQTVDVLYVVGDSEYTEDDLDEDLRVLVSSVATSYIHPQEGPELLRKAQAKFKERLFQNWGRHASVAQQVQAAQTEWEQLRRTANTYLSASLTQSLRRIWPNSETKVDLPENIQDIVAVSDITFRSNPTFPEVTLSEQGTGAQSTILYQSHYILDSDRTLHQGMYFPVWLLEEPESFLHADICVQLGSLLSSKEWLGSIQMIISTHSPIILAASKASAESSNWVVFDHHSIRFQAPADAADLTMIDEIGSLMGDANFGVYFDSSGSRPLVLIEDSRPETVETYRRSGIDVARGLDGTSDVKRYINVLLSLGDLAPEGAFFLVDGDDGISALQSVLPVEPEEIHQTGIRRFRISNRVFVIAFAEGDAVEDLFVEYDDVVQEAVDDILDNELRLREQVPRDLTRAVSRLRSKPPESRDDAVLLLRKEKDVKDRFWGRAALLQISDESAHAIQALIRID